MSKFKVALFGDMMLDIYWLGEATRISPEAPIPVVKIKETVAFPGGAGNVAANLEALGVEVVSFNESGPVKNRLMVDGVQVARWDLTDRCEPTKKLKDSLQDFDAIVVSDYGKGAIDQQTIDYIKSHKDIVPIFVDTKGDPSVWSGVATAIFPNEKERQQYVREYQDFNGIVVAKCGSNGLSIRHGADSKWSEFYPAQARFVKSVNGAGDTVLAAFVYMYLQIKAAYPKGTAFGPEDWEALLDFANAAAAVAVEHEYTYAPTLKEVEERYYGNY